MHEEAPVSDRGDPVDDVQHAADQQQHRREDGPAKTFHSIHRHGSCR